MMVNQAKETGNVNTEMHHTATFIDVTRLFLSL